MNASIVHSTGTSRIRELEKQFPEATSCSDFSNSNYCACVSNHVTCNLLLQSMLLDFAIQSTAIQCHYLYTVAPTRYFVNSMALHLVEYVGLTVYTSFAALQFFVCIIIIIILTTFLSNKIEQLENLSEHHKSRRWYLDSFLLLTTGKFDSQTQPRK